MIARRHVFHIGGYDPIVPDTQLARFHRSLSSFRKTWNVDARASLAPDVSEVSAVWAAQTSGPNWTTETSFEMLRWDDLILKDHERGMASRLGQSMVTLFDWIVTGTLFRFMASSWKYAGFFLFPYLWVALFAIVGAGAGGAIAWLTGLGGVAATLLGALIAVPVFVGLLHWFGPRKPINHVFDDWIFSREFVYGQRPVMENRVDAFAARIVAKARQNDVDEIVIVGHCLGAALVMESVSRAMKLDPQLANHGPTICILTVGATIPKFSLHPKGEHVRQATRDVAAATSIRWAEYHARDDAISFYRFDPVTLKRVSRERGDGRPNIRRVQLHSMMTPASFKRHRFNFMRMHYQFVMGNDLRSEYDYCMIICGPLPFDDITAPPGATGRIAADGALLPAPHVAKIIQLPRAGTSNAA
jgi:hypothetical protein